MEHKCEECNKEFATYDAYRMHMNDKHDIKLQRERNDDDHFTEADYQTWMRL
jgi:hypothetical protein